MLKGERERLSAALHDLGFQVYPSQANYLFFRDREEDGILEKGRLYQELLGRRILIAAVPIIRGWTHPFTVSVLS